MEKKIPIKTIYLLLVISIGLIGLGIGSTYALFTTSTEINNPIALKSDLSYTGDILETIEVEVPAREMVSSTLNITNSSGSSLNYTAWYLDEEYNIEVGTAGDANSTGVLASGSSVPIVVAVKNNSDEDVIITLGVSSSTNNVVLGSSMKTVGSDLVNPLSDFTYYLGSEYSSVDTISYYDDETDAYYDIGIDDPISLDSNEILLTKYIGSSKNVNVSDTYVVDGVTYNITLLPSVSLYYYDSETDVEIDDDDGVFKYNTNIENVSLGNNIKMVDDSADALFVSCTSLVTVSAIPNTITNMSSTFNGCTSLVNAPKIPSSVTDMRYTFNGCTSLVTAPEIPSSVITMFATFAGCTSLTMAPEIPSSVTSMARTFYECTSLVTAPEIPSSVISLVSTFYGCTSLVTAPEIPSSVTNMSGMFQGCTSLTGIVKINSSSVSSIAYIFYDTSKTITVQVPTGSTTYTNISALTTSNGMPSNVTLETF